MSPGGRRDGGLDMTRGNISRGLGGNEWNQEGFYRFAAASSQIVWGEEGAVKEGVSRKSL